MNNRQRKLIFSSQTILIIAIVVIVIAIITVTLIWIAKFNIPASAIGALSSPVLSIITALIALLVSTFSIADQTRLLHRKKKKKKKKKKTVSHTEAS